MKLTNEQLDALEQMGGAFLSTDECAIALELDRAEFNNEVTDPTSEAYKRYWKGVLTEKVKHINSVKELSLRGSSPAQQMIQKSIDALDTRNQRR